METIDCSKVSRIPFQDQKITARIAKIYDGDTIHVVIMLGDYPLMISVRLLGIDCPEVRLTKGVSPEEKKAGIAVRNYVRSLFQGKKLCEIRLTKKDVYCSRFVGEVYLPDGSSLSQHLLAKRFGVPYNGGKKLPWDTEHLNQIINGK